MSSAMDELLAFLKGFDRQKLDYEYRKFQAIREWAFEQIGIDYAEGDRVRIKQGYKLKQFFSDGTPNGWWPYREALAPGATATVNKIDFNASHRYWYAEIVLDREWAVDERGAIHWHRPAKDTPEGMEPPPKYDQEHYPEGRKHTFSFEAKWLERVTEEASALCDTCPHLRPK